jgi:hypothetical protein
MLIKNYVFLPSSINCMNYVMEKEASDLSTAKISSEWCFRAKG